MEGKMLQAEALDGAMAERERDVVRCPLLLGTTP